MSTSLGFAPIPTLTGRAYSSAAITTSRNWPLRMATTLLTPDEGVVKEIVQSGEGKAIEAGDILAVEYYAAVKGHASKPFAKGDKEQFIVQDGSTIKGWDVAVGSMKVGESAKFECSPAYAYGAKGVGSVIPPNADIEMEIKVLAWLGNQLRPESLFQKDLDIDPFISSTPESIQADYDDMQLKKTDKYEGSVIDIYIRRIKNISFGFGGSGFFTSQSGEAPPWYLNPNLTFPAMIAFTIAAFAIVLTTGAVREKGQTSLDLEVAQIRSTTTHSDYHIDIGAASRSMSTSPYFDLEDDLFA